MFNDIIIVVFIDIAILFCHLWQSARAHILEYISANAVNDMKSG